MNKRLKIYLDTSVINFIYADDSPERKEMTIDLFDNFIKPEIYETYISPFVIVEIENTRNTEKRNKLLKVLDKYPIELLDLKRIKNEIEELGDKYVEAGIIPAKKYIDAYHISTSVISRMNYLVSWNYRHLANVKKEQQVHIVNLQNNYRNDLRIITPLELIYYES